MQHGQRITYSTLSYQRHVPRVIDHSAVYIAPDPERDGNHIIRIKPADTLHSVPLSSITPE